MLKVLDIECKQAWDDYVKSFNNWDIYYLNAYANSLAVHGDGVPNLIIYEDNDTRFCYVLLKSDIADSPKFIGLLNKKEFFDYESPYGYGGPLTDVSIGERSQEKFLNEFTRYCKDNNIVSQFIRFHPLLNNYNILGNVIEYRFMRDTIYIDTSDPERIMTNMDSKNRNMVRKAIKNGITIIQQPIRSYQEFLPIYNETMKKDNADSYYFFNNDYFQSLFTMSDNTSIFFAMLNGEPISSAIMFYNDRFMHYHLAGTRTECRQYSPNNLLLYEAACWASKRGIGKFHLGGGLSQDDNLFGFKKQFNKNGRLPFYVGRTIFDKQKYNMLLDVRERADSSFDRNNSFMIQYRR